MKTKEIIVTLPATDWACIRRPICRWRSIGAHRNRGCPAVDHHDLDPPGKAGPTRTPLWWLARRRRAPVVRPLVPLAPVRGVFLVA